MERLPSGTVTLVFTDIEGSSQLWERYRVTFLEALREHNRIMREAAQHWNGHELGTEGDSFFLVFSRSSDAVRFAVEAQLELTQYDWTSLLAGERIRVRIGIHTGELLVGGSMDDGVDYHGPATNRAARVGAAGHGGQIVVSDVARQLAAPSLPPQITFSSLGMHRLRGVGEEHLWQIVAPGLLDEFAELKTLNAYPQNLPLHPTPFIGREREMYDIKRLLFNARIVTLSGPGGMGKTRLALQMAELVIDHFPDGAFFVALAPLSEPSLIAPAIAEALDIHDLSGRPPIKAVADYLRGKDLLLILDNFEHVLDGAAVVSELTVVCPQLTILITSRARLNLQGEHEYAVPSMETPDPTNLPSIELLSHYAAVELFIQTAVAVRPEFAVTNENAPAIAEICHKLDGLPLAIVLAAARAKVLPPQEVQARLESRLELLTGGARDLPLRQRALRSTISWSYDLLNEQEKRLFRRLGVFRGGCSLQSAEAVCNAGQDLNVELLDGISSLVDNSLLRQIEVDGEARFTMLETIREFAIECLVHEGVFDVLRHAHACHFLVLAKETEQEIIGPMQSERLRRLDRDHSNLRAAIAFLHTAGEQEQEMRMVGELLYFWIFRGYINEGLERGILSLDPGLCNIPDDVQAKVLATVGLLEYFKGDAAAAASYCVQALPLCRASNNHRLSALCLCVLGAVSYFQGDIDSANNQWKESEALSRVSGDKWVRAISLSLVGLGSLHQGSVQSALSACNEALLLAREIGEGWSINQVLFNLGLAHTVAGNFPEARAAFEEGLALCRKLGVMVSVSLSLDGLGMVATAQGDSQRAARVFSAAHSIRMILNTPIPPAYRPMYDRSIADVRLTLTPEEFELEWNSGSAESIDQALSRALDS